VSARSGGQRLGVELEPAHDVASAQQADQAAVLDDRELADLAAGEQAEAGDGGLLRADHGEIGERGHDLGDGRAEPTIARDLAHVFEADEADQALVVVDDREGAGVAAEEVRVDQQADRQVGRR
jgi:hypothetical protein